MALDNIPTLGPGSLNGNLDKVLVYKNGGSEVAVSLLTLTNSALNPSGIYLDATNQRVGIGTSSPIAPLNVYNSSSSVSSVILVEQDTSATIGQINQYRKNGSVNLTSGTEIGRLSFGGYFNSTYSPFSQVCSAVLGYYGGTGTDRVGGLRLTTWNGGGATTRLQVAPDGKVSIGTTGSSAKLQIVADGSTSATTSLLVQNSSGTELLKVRDDNKIFLGGSASHYIENGYNFVGSYYWINEQIVRAGIVNDSGSVKIIDDLNVGGNTNNNNSAILQADSTTQGFLPPRMTTLQKNAIVTPAAGLMVYDTDLNRPCFHSGSAWVTL